MISNNNKCTFRHVSMGKTNVYGGKFEKRHLLYRQRQAEIIKFRI